MNSFFLITFDFDGNKFWWFHRKFIVQIYQNITYFIWKNYFLIWKNLFLGEKGKFVAFFSSFFFRNTFKVQWLCKFQWLHYKNPINIYQTTTCFLLKNRSGVKNRFILAKKLEIQVMIMLTCSSERIFIPMHYTGKYLHTVRPNPIFFTLWIFFW